jgi:hypothetical protein
MYQGLVLRARQILEMLGYYVERDLEVPAPDSPLTQEEEAELTPIAAALTIAAVEMQRMSVGVQIATLKKLATAPSAVSDLPGGIQWQLAANHRRNEEKPGEFALDIWGSAQVRAPYIMGEPTPENVARAAEGALKRLESARVRGRPRNPAHEILAERLGPIFRASGRQIRRYRKKLPKPAKVKAIYFETGPFHEFLELILPPLQGFLREQKLAPVSVETVVRETVWLASDS